MQSHARVFESIETKSDAIERMILTGPWRIGQIDVTKDWLQFKAVIA